MYLPTQSMLNKNGKKASDIKQNDYTFMTVYRKREVTLNVNGSRVYYSEPVIYVSIVIIIKTITRELLIQWFVHFVQQTKSSFLNITSNSIHLPRSNKYYT